MKSKFQLLILATLVLLLGSCTPKYKVSITATNNINAPSLQSFSHAKSGSEWLLFAGRTNTNDSLNGGLHKMIGKNNYASTSFPPTSFNENIFVYNVETDEVPLSISLTEMIETVSHRYKSYHKDTLHKYRHVFKNTNALVRQKGEYVYVIGGYGAKDSVPSNGYVTYNHVAKIHVPSMIALVKGNYSRVDKTKLFSFGQNENLVSTGGELYSIGDTFYLVGGHNFTSKSQKYVDAVYPFKIGPLVVKKDTIKLAIAASIGAAISDVSDPKGAASDDTSIFRRRDGPITPSLYYNSLEGKLEESIAIYAGVFKPGEDLQAWNDAIYVHPNWDGGNNKLYTYDEAYNQKNFNVYSCPDVVAYDAGNKTLHTFLLGGIGDGGTNDEKKHRLSGFTNTGMHIQLKVDGSPLKSTNAVFSNNLFSDSETNSKPFYGAEAIFFKNESATSIGESEEIIDMKALFERGGNVDVGYVFGGIEALTANPGTYGKKLSRASNKVWKVTLVKE
jgi:hypothetical protein